MGLIESEVLDIDDPVMRWLPDFQPRLPNGEIPILTVRQLLTHTAGLSYRAFEPADSAYHVLNVSDGLDQPGLSVAENLARLAGAPLVYTPGTSWRYSLATDVLGAVIASASGRSLPVVVRELITGPLQMRDTDFRVIDRARLAVPYVDGMPAPVRMSDPAVALLFGAPLTFAPTRIDNEHSYPSGGAGMAGTAGDVLRFLEAMQSGRGVLRPATLEQMTTLHVGAEAQTAGPGWGFGLGWAVLEDPALALTPQARGTLHWVGVYGHSWFVDRVNALTAVILTNTAFEGMSGAFPIEIRDAIYHLAPS
jgi:CubicO group peptidase (beta-lactamase class C family)